MILHKRKETAGFEEFETFKNIRYNSPPWDLPENQMGFPTYKDGSSDISAHLPILEYFASQCSNITEFGVRDCFSTVALIAGAQQTVTSYDIQSTEATDALEEMNRAGLLPSQWQFRLQSTVDDSHQIEETGFLFIDSLHTKYHLEKELLLHSHKVSRFIGFHDVWSHGEVSWDIPGEAGINGAIDEFLQCHPEFKEVYRVNYNHGLLIIERTD